MVTQPISPSNMHGTITPVHRTTRRRRLVTRIALVSLLACGWAVGAWPADGAAHPSPHAPNDRGAAVRPHVIVLIPPFAVYAAQSLAPPKPLVSADRRAAGLVLQAPSCPAGALLHLVRHPSSHPPATVDLSRLDPPVADEGAVHAGAAWATGYTLLGWWAAKQGLSGAPFAPMSLYAAVAHEANHPVSLAATLAVLARQGIDPQTAYRHGLADYRHRPTAAEQANARPYRIAGYSCVYTRRHSPVTAEVAVKTVLASGQPLVLGVPVYDSIRHASRATPFVDQPARGAKAVGAEAVVAVAYDARGVWVQNAWGPSWGLAGYAELSWAFVNAATQEAWTIAVAHRQPTTTTRRTLVVTATPTITAPLSTSVPATFTAPFSGTASGDTGCAPGAVYAGATPTAAVTGTAPATTTASYLPMATATPTSSLASANAAPSGPSLPGTGTACNPDFSSYAGTVSPYSSSYPTYPTDTSGYATDALSTPSASYPTDGYSYPSAYPTDVTSYLTPTDVPITTTPTASPTSTATPSPTPAPQVAVLPTSGTAGSSVTVSGMGFTPDRLAVQIDGTTIGYFIGGNAPFSFPVTIPTTVDAGTRTITLYNARTQETASTTFTVLAPSSPTSTALPPTATATPSATATLTAVPATASPTGTP